MIILFSVQRSINFLSLFFTILSTLTSVTANVNNFQKLVDLVGGWTPLMFRDCNFFLIDTNFDPNFKNRRLWLDMFNQLSARSELQSYSGGLFNIQLRKNMTQFYSIQRPQRITSQSCGVVLVLLPTKIGIEEDKILSQRLEQPLLNPVSIKNRDKYLIITGNHQIDSLYESPFISSVKFKLILTQDSVKVRAVRFCSFCHKGQILHVPVDFFQSDANSLFPDLNGNYHGSVLKTSASDKLPGLLELKKVGERYVAKRGVYCGALLHLVEKLNFTYELFPSSGGGSTGHPLPNGTWLGTVGDAYSGVTDFGLMAGMTMIRFPVIELCATITFEYISFATGPPTKLYTWKSVFWPFSGFLWIGLIITVGLSVGVAYFLLKTDVSIKQQKIRWTLASTAQFYGRTFLEQGCDFPPQNPPTIPESIRVLLGFWLLFAMVASTAYKSKMVSFMTFPVLQPLPDTFNELEKSSFEIAFHYFGNVAYNTFKTSTNPTFSKIFNRMIKQPEPLKCLEGTLDSKSACILFGIVYDELRFRNLSNRYGNSPIRFSPNYGFMYTPGVVHRKKAALSNNFKWVINTAMEMGLIGQWQKTDLNEILANKNEWIKKNPNATFESKWNPDTDKTLHLPNLVGSFTILITGVLGATLAFLIEGCIHFKSRVKEMNWKIPQFLSREMY